MGPYASQWLGDFGAEVIKVEPPKGDSTRHTGPSTEAGMSAVFLGVNRNKKSVVIDLKHADGQAALLQLIGSIARARPAARAWRCGLPTGCRALCRREVDGLGVPGARCQPAVVPP